MTQQYFQAGEEVILQSVEFTHLNGEAVISDVFPPGAIVFQDNKTRWHNDSDKETYRLYSDSRERIESGRSWSREAIKKKHTPGEDFQSLISSLNNDKVEQV